MRIKLIAASVVALAMATSVSYAQSNPVPNHMATDKNSNEDAGGGAGGSDSSGTKTMKPMSTDSTMTNSTTDQTKCKDGSNAKGALQTQAGKGDATPQDQACGENNN